MVYGGRGCVTILIGVIIGTILSLFLKFPLRNDELCAWNGRSPIDAKESSEFWPVVVKKMGLGNTQPQNPKVVRARFAATELGIRDKLLVMVLGQSSLSVALNASLGRQLPHIHFFAEVSRIDTDMGALSNLSPYRISGQHSHIPILETVFNLTLHSKYDWFFIMPDTTFINSFAIMRFISHISWNQRAIIGSKNGLKARGSCSLHAGILLSYSAMQSLIMHRHLCDAIFSSSDHTAFEQCVSIATNLSCVNHYQGKIYRWWKVGESFADDGGVAAIHDTIAKLAKFSSFNTSLSFYPLLSEADVRALYKHFIMVELDRVDNEIESLSASIRSLSCDISDGPSFPAGLASHSKPHNRHQVPKWEFFTTSELFKNEPYQNVHALNGDDRLDVDELVSSSRRFIEEELNFEGKFVELRNGYRLFDPLRGMDYIIDLIYEINEKLSVRRVHLTRPISNTQLLYQVPYVKEDTDLTIVIPLSSNSEVGALHRLLFRYMRLCGTYRGDTRRTRLIIAVRGLDSSSLRLISNDIFEFRIRCKDAKTETMLLLLKGNSHPILAAASLDEAVDHFGQQMIYLLLPPYADIQHEFLDRVRINTIKRYQIFFPVPFVEFHSEVVTASEAIEAVMKGANANNQAAREIGEVDKEVHVARDGFDGFNTLKNTFRDISFRKINRPLVVHKNQGHFDSSDFSVLSLYGADYIYARAHLDEKSLFLDLSSLFVGQSEVHAMRAVEPSLRLRYHIRSCDPELVDSDYARCLLSRREGLASKAQLANVLFYRKNDRTESSR